MSAATLCGAELMAAGAGAGAGACTGAGVGVGAPGVAVASPEPDAEAGSTCRTDMMRADQYGSSMGEMITPVRGPSDTA